jgi:hypothetical protein
MDGDAIEARPFTFLHCVFTTGAIGQPSFEVRDNITSLVIAFGRYLRDFWHRKEEIDPNRIFAEQSAGITV